MFGIDEAPSKGEKTQSNQLNASSGFATGQGEGDITASSTFMRDILSGDPSRAASALAPEISQTQKGIQQQKNQTAQFGTRSGGNAATIANADTAGRSNIINLLGGARQGAASSLGSMGTNLLGLGMAGNEAGFNEAKTMQAQNAAKWSDIIQSIASTATGVLGALPGAAGGLLDKIGNATGAIS